MRLSRIGLILLTCAVAALICGFAPPAQPPVNLETVNRRRPRPPKVHPPAAKARADVPFVPTPGEVVRAMLKLAELKPDETVYDLGSGDGCIILAAARDFKAFGFGFEINPRLIARSKMAAAKARLQGRAEFFHADLFDVDLSGADVVTLYLLPELNLKLRPRLHQLKRGARIVSHDFDMGDYPPQKTVSVKDAAGVEHEVYLWTAPLKKAK